MLDSPLLASARGTKYIASSLLVQGAGASTRSTCLTALCLLVQGAVSIAGARGTCLACSGQVSPCWDTFTAVDGRREAAAKILTLWET